MFWKPSYALLAHSRYYDLMKTLSNLPGPIDAFENANVQGAGNDNMNEEGGDVVIVDQTEQSDHVVQIGGIDIAADDEA
ncbi:hypothetical protein Tco_1540588 [Tanacetum coccineum]